MVVTAGKFTGAAPGCQTRQISLTQPHLFLTFAEPSTRGGASMTVKMKKLALLFLSLLLALPNLVGAQENFYKGKTIRMIVGTSAGGGFDTYTRTIARHFGKHVPGQPAIVVENMAGAGHLIAANHMYQVAKPDGLTIGHFHGGWFLYQVFKRPGIEFDAAKFEFLGSPIKESRACAFTKASGITSVERWLAS